MFGECKSGQRTVASRVASWLIFVGGLAVMAGLPLLTTNAEYAWPREAEILAGHARDYARNEFEAGTWDGRRILNLPTGSKDGRGSFVYPAVVPISGAGRPRARVYVICTADAGRKGFASMDFDLPLGQSTVNVVWIDPKVHAD